jgi:peptidoglycan hydrolase-like protein with peptidoglycan-binding domain
MVEFPTNPGPLPSAKLCNRQGAGKANPVFGDGPLATGDQRKDLVKHLQTLLRDSGFSLGETGEKKDGVDGIFGDRTKQAVEDFQKANLDWEGNELKIDSLVGPKTSDSMNRAMVGKWYDLYRTPRQITPNKIVIALLGDPRLNQGIDISTSSENGGSAATDEIRLFLIDFQEFQISLFDANGEKFSQFETAHVEILDAEENILSEGDVTRDDEIKVFSSATPKTARLKIEKVIYEFPLS